MEPSPAEVFNYMLEGSIVPLSRTIGGTLGAGLNAFTIELTAHFNFFEKLIILMFVLLLSIFLIYSIFKPILPKKTITK